MGRIFTDQMDDPTPKKRRRRTPRKLRAAKQPDAAAPAPPRPEPTGLGLRKVAKSHYEFQPPECAVDRVEDIDEVHRMIDGGEPEIARDELLYLVADCRAFLEAHNLLGELALEEGDLKLARGHYGFAYETGIEALSPGFRGVLPSGRGYNVHFFQAGLALARCLIALHNAAEGREVLEKLLKLDPRDANARSLLDELDS